MPAIDLKSKLPSVTAPSLKNLTVKDFGRVEDEQTEALQSITRPHVESFNWFINFGLRLAAKSIPPIQTLIGSRRFSVCFADAYLEKPKAEDGTRSCRNLIVYPSECRQRGGTYSGKLRATVSFYVDDVKQSNMPVMLGSIPIMVKSDKCNLHGLRPKELVEKQEEAEEMGGYFVVNGNEKILRMLVMQRRNFPLGVMRPSWKNRGPNYTEYAVLIRSMSLDQTVISMYMHYLKNGKVMVCVFHRKEMFFIPLMIMLKCLKDAPDVEIYKELIKTKEDDTYFKTCVQNMMRETQASNLHLHKDFLRFVGDKFRIKLNQPPWMTDAEIAKYLLKHNVLIHLKKNDDKFRLLCLMTRKLFDLAMNKCLPDNLDSVQNQEILLPGQLYVMVLREKLTLWLLTLSRLVERHFLKKKDGVARAVGSTLTATTLYSLIKSVPDVSHSMSYLLATGNVVSKTGLGLQQTTGLAIVADKLNFLRYVSHFRSLHRGAFFAGMQTTEVRKLLPESWGFLCPVHTPDGAPCGLKNHLSYLCEVVTDRISNAAIVPLLYKLGMLAPDSGDVKGVGYYPVVLNGLLIGWLLNTAARGLTESLRVKKCNGEDDIPHLLEICLIEKTEKVSQCPALYLMTDLARMVRPVMNLKTGNVEMIGSFEQVYLDICIIPEEAHEQTTHQELTQSGILSVVASFTPYSDFNQSPRNMYQCQMGKQTMGTPCHALPYRADNKLYRIQTPQSPMVRPFMYDHYKLDNYPFGTNAVVAVISYTAKDSSMKLSFGLLPNDRDAKEILESGRLQRDGLPAIGQRLEHGDPYYAYINHSTGGFQVVNYTGQEAAVVDNIKVLSNHLGSGTFKRIYMVLRVQRNPIIGDKFASRHGQKGICSQLWPIENIPFTESGLYPDIIFNPHGFPSRMTIGMMIESMAGKAAALHGEAYDATPFSFSENHSAIDHFGRTLRKAGFSYYGTEKMYSGVSGLELEAEIFIGVVYYQRLRHMVSDKFQVRTTGPVDRMTQQPVQGRKKQGGIRFGEMERDALLAHGCSHLLLDRLLLSSDRSFGHLCTKCGSIIAPLLEKGAAKNGFKNMLQPKWKCTSCKSDAHIELHEMPSVYRYLVNELAAMNIRTVVADK